MKTSKYFSPEEFKGCSPACSIDDMDQGFLGIMDQIREEVGQPLAITSAYRPKKWELSKGRSGNGAHTRGLAVDFACTTGTLRAKIVKAALSCGIKRIGIAGSFVHVDIDDTLPQNVIWTY